MPLRLPFVGARGYGLVPAAPDPITPLCWRRWKSTTNVATSGGFVDSWTDIVAGEVVTAAGANRPAFTASVANGRPGATFDGIDDYLRSTAPAATWNHLHSGIGADFYLVFRPNTTQVAEMAILATQAGTGRGARISQQQVAAVTRYGVWSGVATVMTPTTAALVAGTPCWARYQFQDPNYTLQVDGNAATSGVRANAPSAADASQPLTFGQQATLTGLRWTGTLIDAIFAAPGSVWSAAQHTTIQNALTLEYAI